MSKPNFKLEDFPKKEDGKLNIYFHLGENSGVGYYRQYLPALALKEHGLANILISDFRWGEGQHQEPDDEFLFAIVNWADLIVVGRRDQKEFYAKWGGIKEFFRIPVILDTDDNIRHVRPSNPGYQGYHPGAEAEVWNRYGIAKIFDAVTVSTQELYEVHKKENPKTFLLPNNLPVQEWEKHTKPKLDDNIHIGFICSAAHWEGVDIIRRPLLDIMQKYLNVTFHLTHSFIKMVDYFPEEIKKRIVPVPWIKLEQWPKTLKELGLDIGLAPLADNLFNRAKSNLRWMEYSICVVAPIVSPVRAYTCVKNGITGLIAKERQEWYDAMEKLILDANLRSQIAQNAHDEVAVDYDIDRNIGLWESTYRGIYDKYYEFFDPKKRFMMVKDGRKKLYREVKKLSK